MNKIPKTSTAEAATVEAATEKVNPISIPLEKLQSYSELIEEVYINPIRSAIIVDDNYPTLEDYLNGRVGGKSSEDLLSIITALRQSPRNWSIDVNDGNAISGTEYGQLHQSDLMILDYHLEGDDGGATKAITVLRSLAANNYFNLVIVYTASDGVDDTNSRVMTLVEGLTFLNPAFMENPLQVPDVISRWEDIDVDITTKLTASLDKLAVLRFIQQQDLTKWKNFSGFENITQLIADRSKAVRSNIGQAVIDWVLKKKIREISSSLSNENYGEIEFSLGEVNWIKSSKLFVTVIPKNVPASELTNKLLKAIEESKPSPHQLLMTKIRNVLDEQGVKAEKTVLNKRKLQAYWLKEMFNATDQEYPWQLSKTIDHHWSSLAAEINSVIQVYGSSLFRTLKSQSGFNIVEFIKSHTSIDVDRDEDLQGIKEEWNSFISTKNSDIPYISTGSVFKITKIVNTEVNETVEEYWVCLSPACDLVPGQKSKWCDYDIELAGIIPFKAVKLIPQTNSRSLKTASSNEYLFINKDDKIKSFGFVNPGSNPSWNQFFAHTNGYFNGGKLEVSCLHIKNISEGKPETITHEAEFVTQLRYEYALNLLQKLGGSLSRIGLDFVEHKSEA